MAEVTVARLVGNSGAILDGSPGSAAPSSAIQVGGTDGTDLRALLLDVLGQLKTISGQQANASAATWTSATTVNTTLTVTNGLDCGVTFSYSNTGGGTVSAGAVTIETTVDGTNWSSVPYGYVLSANNLISSIIPTGNPFPFVSFANMVAGFAIPNFGYTGIRLRLSTAIVNATGSPSFVFSYATNGIRVTPVVGVSGNGGLANGAPVWVGTSDANGTLRPMLNVQGYTDGVNIYQLQTHGYLFNGVSYDRQRGNWNTSTGDTGTQTSSFNGATQTNYDSTGAIITVILGTVSGSTPTLSVQFQWSPDGGSTWINMGPALANLTASSQTGTIIVHPNNTSQAAGTSPVTLTTGDAAFQALNVRLARTWRLVYTLGGGSPSFAITKVSVAYLR